ncbi:MAG: hypothetical protein CME64_14745 [Halobacteriovoraceae bacterium]|nr:hypothetical protein [Halobacteriovoraceae bacterium]|tara:strand:+ start:20058 stop:20807 length:750 start_codon:yes stop_codon:yes gene_type:complete
MFKKILLLIALIYVSLAGTSYAKTSIISDIDETVKRTRGESFRGLYHSIMTHKVFSGMDTLLKRAKGDLFFVSEDYNFLEFNVEKLIKENKLKAKEVFTRVPFAFESEHSYKYETVKRIMDSSKDKFILIGDDSGVDQDVYTQIAKDYPGRVAEIYIHVVKNEKPLNRNVTPYFTAFDIAVNEFKNNRFTKDQVMEVGRTLLKEEKFHKVFPKYAHCPKTNREIKTRNVPLIERLIGSVSKKTLDYCNS